MFLSIKYGNKLMEITVLARKKLDFGLKNFGYWRDTTKFAKLTQYHCFYYENILIYNDAFCFQKNIKNNILLLAHWKHKITIKRSVENHF